jgi:threonine synthase
MTPLVTLQGMPGDVRAKLEFVSPTGSFKDRGTAVAISRLKELGIADVVGDSSGNAGSSLAAYCAAAGVRCKVYVPRAASKGKLIQMRIYGATVVPIEGPRAAATEAALSAAGSAYYASHVWDPYFLEGTQTAAFEILEQLGGMAPARVVLPVGQGTLLLGLAHGFRRLFAAGRIKHLPELIAVQSDACAPLYEVFRHRLEELPRLPAPRQILAEGIAAMSPLRWRAVIGAIGESRGNVIRVDDQEIRVALSQLGKYGLFVEPTAATTLGALRQLMAMEHEKIKGTTVLMLTGSGLKTSSVVENWLGDADGSA